MTNTNQLPAQINDMIAQLGGGRIFAMAFQPGKATYTVAGEEEAPHAAELRLQIARDLVKFAPGKATHVVVRLEWADVYTVQLVKVNKISRRTFEIPTPVTVTEIPMVYADVLKNTVETMTGFRLSL